MASAIKHSPSLRAKVLLLNTTNDRETHGYAAVDYVEAIVQTLNRCVPQHSSLVDLGRAERLT